MSTNLASQRSNAEHIAVCGTVQLAARGEELEVYHSMSAAQQLLSPYVSYSCAVVRLLVIISLTSRIPPAPLFLHPEPSTYLPHKSPKHGSSHKCPQI